MTDTHTPGHILSPLPWSWDGDVCNYNPDEEAPWLVDREGESVLTGEIKCNNPIDAAFICEAVNNHDRLKKQNAALREALQEARSFMDSCQINDDPLDKSDDQSMLDDLKARTDAALSSVEGK